MKTLYDSCPLCDSLQFAVLGEADCTKYVHYTPALPARLRWMRCASCDHVFTDGYWTPAALGLLFSATHPGQSVGCEAEQQRFVSARMIEKVLPYRAAGRWLDVGFGNASLLLTAREYGFEPVGLDLRASEVESLRKMGVPAHLTDISDFETTDTFSVVSLMDVLEHIPYPKKALATAHRILEPDGVLYLSMPNIDSDVWKLLDVTKSGPYWGEMEHHHNFGRVRLYSLLREYGFEPLRYSVSERYRVCMEVVARRSDSMPLALLDDALAQGVVAAGALATAAGEAGSAFRVNNIGDAGARMADLVEGVRSLCALLGTVSTVLGVSLEQMEGNGRTVSAQLAQFVGQLESIIEAQQSQDWSTVADLLEYDFQPALQEWQLVFDALRAGLSKRS